MEHKVPNYNALSSLLDRLAIENIKLSHFENALEHDDPTPDRRAELEAKAAGQRDMIEILKRDTAALMHEALRAGEYRYIAEGRTFE
ncbi:MAG: hypothetical protein AAF458_13240 [Pseudomonadota bacterium]